MIEAGTSPSSWLLAISRSMSLVEVAQVRDTATQLVSTEIKGEQEVVQVGRNSTSQLILR